MTDRFAEWRTLQIHGALVRMGGGCDPCGRLGYVPIHRRRFWWFCQGGHAEGLCFRHCIIWWNNALDDPDLMPARVVMVGNGT